jgi:hypothetical protein
MCWDVARPPKIGGIVKTVRSIQNDVERTTERTVASSGVKRPLAETAAPSLAGRTVQAKGTSAATATAYPATAARHPKRVIAHWHAGASA